MAACGGRDNACRRPGELGRPRASRERRRVVEQALLDLLGHPVHQGLDTTAVFDRVRQGGLLTAADARIEEIEVQQPRFGTRADLSKSAGRRVGKEWAMRGR